MATPDEITERIDAFSEGSMWMVMADEGVDGWILIIRRLFGFSGGSLTAGRRDRGHAFDPDDIRDFIDSLSP